MEEDYRALAGGISAREWAKKYYGLKRNYDSVSRICQEKCTKNEQLEGEIGGLIKKKNKFDQLFSDKEELAQENKKLIENNQDLRGCVKELQRKLNLSDIHLNETKQTLKHKAKIHLELENVIQSLSKSLSETQEKQNRDHRKVNEYMISVDYLNTKIEKLENQCYDLNENVKKSNSENEQLKTKVIQKDNIILSKDNMIKSLTADNYQKSHEYDRLYQQYLDICIKYKEIEAESANSQMDAEILKNRLKRYESNEENENDGNNADKLQSLRDMINDLETQNRYNLITIDDLTKMKTEYLQFKAKYDELKENNDWNEDKIKMVQKKYDNLYAKYQANHEELNRLSNKFKQIEAENNSLKQNVNEKENELNQLHKQNSGLNDSYKSLQQQYSSYLHQKNEKKVSELSEIKILSERQNLLKNDFQRLLLENEEWINKYNNLKATYDALNDDYVNCKNHSLQIESLMKETKVFHAKNIEQVKKNNEAKLQELNKEIKLLNDKINDIKNENIILKNKPTLSISEYTMLSNKENQLTDIISKMLVADQSLEPSFKCTICCELYTDPITCQPCGHSYCQQCIQRTKDVCKHCKIKIKYFPNEILENLTNKYKMRVNTYLPALQQIAKRKTNVSGTINI